MSGVWNYGSKLESLNDSGRFNSMMGYTPQASLVSMPSIPQPSIPQYDGLPDHSNASWDTTAPAEPGFWKSFSNSLRENGVIDSVGPDGQKLSGWGGLALSGLGGLANLYMGMKQYGLAKDQLAFQKSSFNKNWEAQANLTNAQLEAQNNRRVSEGLVPTKSTADYLAQYGVKK